MNDSFTYDANTIRIFSSLFFVFTAVFGIMGNVSLCYVILKTKSLRTHLNSYIMNIAIADLLSCLVLMPLRIVAASERAWNVNVEIVCGGEMFVRVTVDAARLFFLAYVSYERYLAIANPFNRDKRIPKVRAVIATCIIWTTAIGLASMAAVFFRNTTLMESCESRWEDHKHGLVEVYVLAPVFVFTVTLIILFYILIIRILMKHRSTMSRYLGSKSKNKVKPMDDHVAVSSTPQNQLENQHDNLAVISSTSNSEVHPNVQSDVENANINTVESTERPNGKERMCVSEHDKEKIQDITDASSNKNILSIEKNHKDNLDSTTLTSAKNISEIQTAGNPIVIPSVKEEIPIIRVDDVTDSKHMLVEDFSSEGDASPDNLVYKQRKLGVDHTIKGGHRNALNVVEQNVGQPINKSVVDQLPTLGVGVCDQKQCQTELSKCKDAPTVSEHQNDQTACTHEQNKLTVVENNTHKTTALNDSNKMAVEDDNIHQNKATIVKDKEKISLYEQKLNQSITVSSNVITENNHLLKNNDALTDDKTAVIVYDLEQNETVPLKSEPPVNSEDNAVQSNITTLSEESHTVAEIRTKVSAENCDDSFSEITIRKKTSEGDKDCQMELTTNVKMKNEPGVLASNSENCIRIETLHTTISGEKSDNADPVVNAEAGSKRDVTVDNTNNTTAGMESLRNMTSDNKNASSDLTTQTKLKDKTANCENSVNKANAHNNTLSEKDSDSEPVVVVKVKKGRRSKSPADKTKNSKQKTVRTVKVVDMDGKVHRESLSKASGAVCKRDDDNKIRGRRKVELKAAKRIIAVIGTFFSLWIPFPFSVILSGQEAMTETQHVMWLHVILLMSSVSAMTSAVMPVLNGVSNKQIKSAAVRIYRKLVCAHCKKGG